MSQDFELRTNSLLIRRLSIEDGDFVLTLLNTPGWIEHIGDKGVRNIDDAKEYLLTGPMNYYSEGKGLGLHAVVCNDDQSTVALCGLLQRSYLDSPDLGYAILPEYGGRGIVKEACLAILEYARKTLNLKKLSAITSLENKRSIGLLGKLEFKFYKEFELDGEPINLYEIDL